jgi:pentatricopeptide repeat protein
VQKEIREKVHAWRENPQPLKVTPPSPEWLRYALTEVRPPSLRKEIVALSNPAQGVGTNDPVIQLEAMISLIEDQEYAAAAHKAMAVVRRLSGNAYACAGACQALAYAGGVEQAVQLGLRAVTLDAKSELAWRSLGIALALEKKPDPTAVKFMESLARQPAAAYNLYYHLGMQKVRTGRNQEAAELLEKALEAQPDDLKALQALAEARLNLAQFEAATEVLRRAVALRPSDAASQANLGWALLNQRKPGEAVKVLRTAVELDPGSAMYHNDLAGCLAMLDRHDEAIPEFRRAIELNRTFWDAHYNLAGSLAVVGNLSEAVEHYREVIRLAPSHRDANFSLGVVLHRLGERDEAIRAYREQVRLYPKFAPVYTALVRVYCENEEYELAWGVVRRARGFNIEVGRETLAALRRANPEGEE